MMLVKMTFENLRHVVRALSRGAVTIYKGRLLSLHGSRFNLIDNAALWFLQALDNLLYLRTSVFPCPVNQPESQLTAWTCISWSSPRSWPHGLPSWLHHRCLLKLKYLRRPRRRMLGPSQHFPLPRGEGHSTATRMIDSKKSRPRHGLMLVQWLR